VRTNGSYFALTPSTQILPRFLTSYSFLVSPYFVRAFNPWLSDLRNEGDRKNPGGAWFVNANPSGVAAGQRCRRPVQHCRLSKMVSAGAALGLAFLLFAVIVIMRMNRSEHMREHKVTDLVSLFDPVFDGRAEMNSSIDPGFTILRGGL
jgi:hypothetical protein